MKNGSVISTSSTPRPGVSVRATIQASRIGERQRQHGLDQRDADGVEQHQQVLGRGEAGVAVEVERRRPCRAASSAGCRRAASPSDRATGSRGSGSAAAMPGRPAVAPQAARTTRCARPRGRQRSPSSRLLPPKARIAPHGLCDGCLVQPWSRGYSAASGSRFLFSRPSGLLRRLQLLGIGVEPVLLDRRHERAAARADDRCRDCRRWPAPSSRSSAPARPRSSRLRVMAIMRSDGARCSSAAVDDLAHAFDHRLVLPADALDAGVVDVLLHVAVDQVVVLAPRHEAPAAEPVVGVRQVLDLGLEAGDPVAVLQRLERRASSSSR